MAASDPYSFPAPHQLNSSEHHAYPSAESTPSPYKDQEEFPSTRNLPPPPKPLAHPGGPLPPVPAPNHSSNTSGEFYHASSSPPPQPQQDQNDSILEPPQPRFRQQQQQQQQQYHHHQPVASTSSQENAPSPRPYRSSFFGGLDAPPQDGPSTNPSADPNDYYPPSPSPSDINFRSTTYEPVNWNDAPSSPSQQLPPPPPSSHQQQIERPSSFYSVDQHVKQNEMRASSSPNLHPGAIPRHQSRHLSQSFNPSRASTFSTQGLGMRSLSSGPFLDHSHLKPGNRASLLSHNQTLELYRANVKKTNDPSVSYEFAVFMLTLARESKENGLAESESSTLSESDSAGGRRDRSSSTIAAALTGNMNNGGGSGSLSPGGSSSNSSTTNNPNGPATSGSPNALISEATTLLSRLANRGHVPSALLLGDLLTQGHVTTDKKGKNKPDYEKALPFFVLAAKHGDPEGCFRAGECYDEGWGTRKDFSKAVQFYRKAASQSHPDAMYRLGIAHLNSASSSNQNLKDGVKWLKLCAALVEEMENAGSDVPTASIKALHELALLHERGLEHIVFADLEYAAELLAKAAELGNATSAMKLGECYEYGRMGCPQDSALSIHYYNIAAQQGVPEGCFALTAWYLVGSPGVLPQSDTEAYLWAVKAAEKGLAKACYAVGYFTENGMGTYKDEREAVQWFTKAAERGDNRAIKRLKQLRQPVPPLLKSDSKKRLAKSHPSYDQNINSNSNNNINNDFTSPTSDETSSSKKDGDCIIS